MSINKPGVNREAEKELPLKEELGRNPNQRLFELIDCAAEIWINTNNEH